MIARLQALLRWLFMHAEGWFNRAFGDRQNPLYHLGSIGFFLFWIVAASGLYLYAFFDTSVAGAYTSVHALTHEQWFAGGLARSLHRYASDAMVAVMAVHLVRHFAFDRFRTFRAFSWLTGIVLLGLVYTAGANGYMLPWDRLAQFVLDATLEWLGMLPGLGGTLTRNVIYPSSINDRFFSLLVFIHIGVPLMTLLLMWIHVQRVPKASMQPPRTVAVGVVLMLLLLAVWQPATSRGGAADLRVSPTALDLDWFFLGGYPLIYRWSAGAVWLLVGSITILLAALPWLPMRRRGAQRDEFQLAIHPGGHHVIARSGETLLEAGLRAAVPLPHECRNGACGACVCTILHGDVDHGSFQPAALTLQMREQGKALMCCATARSDVEIEIAAQASVQAAPARSHIGRVVGLEPLTDDVMRLRSALRDNQRIRFTAGQYINIVLEDGQRRAFSFANPPHDNEQIELHVRLIPGGRFTTHVFTNMRLGDLLRFEGPLGRFTLREGAAPILFVAGATGFAPIKSILEDAFRRGLQRPMHLYWGVRRRRDLYMLDLVERWQREHANFRITAVLSEPDPRDGWLGRTGFVHEAILTDHPDLTHHEVYVCGSVNLVDAAVPAFLARGLPEDACLSDAFQPAAMGGGPGLQEARDASKAAPSSP
jgi:CDP-4-dehydro-6-deoxyglucose reductase